ncbi:MAG: hypothetical protein GY696_01465 [Gammaproteobacteria bacterium]|nr:hypothetical protein [Gammaproteobacteria bacterium]
MVQASLLASACDFDCRSCRSSRAFGPVSARGTCSALRGDTLTENLLGLLGGASTESNVHPTVSKGKKKLFLIPEMLDDPLQVDSLEDQLKEVNTGPSGTLYFLPVEKVKKKKALSQISPVEFSQANLKALRKNIEAGVITSLDQVAGYCSHGEAVMSYLVEDDAIKPKVYEFDQRVRVAVVEEGAEWGDDHQHIFNKTLRAAHWKALSQPSPSQAQRQKGRNPGGSPTQAPRFNAKTPSSVGFCFRFNAGNPCNSSFCKFRHVCNRCGGENHPATSCPNPPPSGGHPA